MTEQSEIDMNEPELSALFSERAGRTGDQPINYLLNKAMANPDLISLAAGLVDYETLPVKEISQILMELLGDTEAARSALQYGTTQGLIGLREKVIKRLADSDGALIGRAGYDVERTIISTGSQQLLYLLSEVLLDAGDVVIIGAPSYFVFMGALKTSGVRCVAVPLDNEGMSADSLARELAALERAGELRRLKLIYLMSYYQNPTGITISDERRDRLMDVIAEFRRKGHFYVVEDAAYRELRYDGPDIPSIRSRDADGNTVCYLGTFSKPFSPGLRTGFGALPEALIKPMLRLKANHDFGSGNFSQHILERALAGGLFDGHIRQLENAYRTKRDAMLKALDEFMPTGTTITRPGGGLYVWVELPEGTETGSDSKLFAAALANGMLYVPGTFCYSQNGDGPTGASQMRLSFGVASPEQIREGVRRLGAAIAQVRET